MPTSPPPIAPFSAPITPTYALPGTGPDVACTVMVTVAVPGPLTWLHATDRPLPVGKPSSLAVPVRLALAGAVIDWSGPASTEGARFGGSVGVLVAAGVGVGVLVDVGLSVGTGVSVGV